MPNYTAEGFLAPDEEDPIMPVGQRQLADSRPAPSRSEAILNEIRKKQGSRFGVGFLDRQADKEINELMRLYGQVADQESHQANQSRFDREFKSREQDRDEDRAQRAEAARLRTESRFQKPAIEERYSQGGKMWARRKDSNIAEPVLYPNPAAENILSADDPKIPSQIQQPADPPREREFAPKTPQMYVGPDGQPYSWTPGAASARPIQVPGGASLTRPGGPQKPGDVTEAQTAKARAIQNEIEVLENQIKADPALEPELRTQILRKQRDLRQAIGAYGAAPTSGGGRVRDYGPANGKPDGKTGKAPDGTPVIVRGGRVVAQ